MRRVRSPRKAWFTWKGSLWLGGSLVLILAAIALYLFTGTASSEPSRAQKANASDIVYGPANARVVLIEYSDFQCQYCAGYAKLLAPLRSKYGDRVLFVFRFFPLENHPYAMVSAQAAYAAQLQGKFWEMHDLLFAKQREWSEAADPTLYFEGYATLLGLDIQKFRKDFDAATTRGFIAGQKDEGMQAGVDHTPWFIIDDMVVQPRTVEQFESLIQAAL